MHQTAVAALIVLGWLPAATALGQNAPPPPNPGSTDGRAATSEATAPAGTNTAPSLGPGESEASAEDRVKSVQRKPFPMARRLSVTGDFSFSVNDPFFQKLGGGIQVSYAFSEPFALALRFDAYQDYQTDNAVKAKQVLTAQLYATHLISLEGFDFVWTPVYGKFALFNKIIGFNFYVEAGGGAVKAEQGYLPASDVGLGERIFLFDWLSVGVEGRYLFYVDHAAGGPSTLQRPLLLGATLSVWTPAPGGGEGP